MTEMSEPTVPHPDAARVAPDADVALDADRLAPDVALSPAGQQAPGRTAPAEVEAATRCLLLDLVHGRRPLGSSVHVAELVREHGIEPAAARLAVARLRDAGLLACSSWSTGTVVTWHPAQDRLLLRRLVRLVEAVADRAPDLEALPEPPARPALADALGLALPEDVARAVTLLRSLFTVLPEPVRSGSGPELLDLLEVACSDEALRVDGSRRSLPAPVRDVVVDRLELAAHLGDWQAVREIVRDLAEALEPEVPGRAGARAS